MIYKTVIKKIEIFDEYQGYLFVELKGSTFSCLFYGDEEFIKNNLQIGQVVDIDLWLLDGTLKTTDSNKKEFFSTKGEICGSITDYRKPKYYRIKCNGISIDVENVNKSKEKLQLLKIGDKIEYEGTLQAFFPQTCYSFENVWNLK